jgi:D-alanyl-D-alanine carboxypeptidase
VSFVRTSTFTVTSTLNGATKTYNLQNTNNLLNDDPYPGANGVKTGTTNIVNSLGTDKVVAAVCDSNGGLKLITLSVDRYGRITRLGDSGENALH